MARNYADEFIASTAAQSDRFMVPAPADYLACDRTINEERMRLRHEIERLWPDRLWERVRAAFGPGFTAHRFNDMTHEQVVAALVDAECPRAWLDRRLREVL